GMGAVCTIAAALFALAFGWQGAADVVLVLMVVFATLESAFALCVGCKIFGLLMRTGLVPQQTCAACSKLSLHVPEGALAGES
ncbi:MAG: DUF4395 family protein, partial [Solirubrobacterales bacterium]|nr:DUF4395 family protein [Solirubrobacterales bacterium]